MSATPPVTTELIHRLVPFSKFLEVTFSTLTTDRVVAQLPARGELATIGAGVHGGAQMALADIAAAVMAVLAGGDPTAAPATMQSSTNFLRPARGDLTATATVERAGRSTVIDVTITDEHDSVTALVRQIVQVRPSRQTSGPR
ncbi:PaaI family thioesterase [Amnibacterium endophyticum]|uniref:PaaI family thioesterase n=1 Tax=Amnibacterium endophyticum TaxID=2109337 RepID=A0ABW4LGK5_9MICO